MMRRILGESLADELYRIRSKQEIKHCTNTNSDIEDFMDTSGRLTKQIVEFYENRGNSEIRTDIKLAENKMSKTGKPLDEKWKVDPEEKPKMEAGTTWSKEKKGAHSKIMREIWAQIKASHTSMYFAQSSWVYSQMVIIGIRFIANISCAMDRSLS